MPSIREYNVKLKGLKNTQKITKTMKMVSASKLRKAQEAQANAKLYASSLSQLISRISATVHPSAHPLLIAHPKPSKALILVFTSDKGLCGSFNHNAHKAVLKWIKANEINYSKIDLSFCGKRGQMFFRRTHSIRSFYENVTANPDFAQAEKIGNEIALDFYKNEYDEVYVAYNEFISPLSQNTIFEKVLPIDPKSLITEEISHPNEYLFEPAAPELLNFLIPHYLFFKIYFALLENSAGEHGARMSAMDSATKNASELIETNTLLRNRARQASITTELTEIVAGAEALK